ncbi:DNA adenine methylase [Burkholderia catarinensis]|uniref:DNA adenine methylase n=1 Tax=Burkholderia catarinensis TaxID=1108140 RepID=UPI000AD8BB44|nr:Dam family site-specific DNA-(adenine-N6)-methyltransferase [Burkholderia catarinensis]KAG8154163.1 DNA methyltransferase [Burkholderia catarinensis]
MPNQNEQSLGAGITPFLKWAGGKRWLAQTCLELFPQTYGTYFEPFLGGGAMFFKLRPHKAVLADMNRELIETYSAIAENYQSVHRRIRKYHDMHSVEQYYSVRALAPRNRNDLAARFIYLNRTCWNGLYRVNKNGQFNVPIGTKSNVLLDTDDWPTVSAALRQAKLLVSDFEPIIDQAKRNDIVFADPPYTVKHNNNGFIKYNENIFAWQDQVRLRDALLRAKKRGAHIFCTNADHSSIREIYEEQFTVTSVARGSVISGKADGRGKTSELLITA